MTSFKGDPITYSPSTMHHENFRSEKSFDHLILKSNLGFAFLASLIKSRILIWWPQGLTLKFDQPTLRFLVQQEAESFCCLVVIWSEQWEECYQTSFKISASPPFKYIPLLFYFQILDRFVAQTSEALIYFMLGYRLLLVRCSCTSFPSFNKIYFCCQSSICVYLYILKGAHEQKSKPHPSLSHLRYLAYVPFR